MLLGKNLRIPVSYTHLDVYKRQAAYCGQLGVSPAENGSIVLNRIWDSRNSNFRYKEYVPFLSENQDTMTLQNVEDAAAAAALPVLGLSLIHI